MFAYRINRMKDESSMVADSSPSEVPTDSHSEPHLTQLLDEINKASEDEENKPVQKWVSIKFWDNMLLSDKLAARLFDGDICTTAQTPLAA